jgi:hypothetical protein
MRQLPEEVLRDADRCPEPWADLCTNQFIPRGFHGLFRACASVRPAALHLVHSVYSRGNWVEQAKRAITEVEREKMVRRLFPMMWRAGAGVLWDAAAQNGGDTLRAFEEREARLLRMRAKQKGKSSAAVRSDKPTAKPIRLKRPLAYLMVTGWLRCGDGDDPGLCFYSDEALTALFELFDWQGFHIVADDLTNDAIEQMRGRLGLRKALEKLPYVTGARMNGTSDFIELNTLDSKVAKRQWSKTPSRLGCKVVLDGRVLYRGTST